MAAADEGPACGSIQIKAAWGNSPVVTNVRRFGPYNGRLQKRSPPTVWNPLASMVRRIGGFSSPRRVDGAAARRNVTASKAARTSKNDNLWWMVW